MLRKIIVMTTLLLMTAAVAAAGSRNYISPDELKGWLESGKDIMIVDIQEAGPFKKHHFPGSIETNAYPVKKDSERKKLDPAVALAKKSGKEVVVVCPRGGGGAKRCYDYMKNQGVDESRLHILKGGIDKWPHRQMLQKGTGG